VSSRLGGGRSSEGPRSRGGAYGRRYAGPSARHRSRRRASDRARRGRAAVRAVGGGQSAGHLMTLVIDIGNARLKWARADGEMLSDSGSALHVNDHEEALAALGGAVRGPVARIVVA